MNSISARSYYIGFGSIDRLDSILFFYNYYLTWSLGFISSFAFPILFSFYPSFLNMNRTIYSFIVCLVCLSNVCCILTQPFMLTSAGDLNLSFDTCRFIVYISTLTKPVNLYVIFLYSIEKVYDFFLKIYFELKIKRNVFIILISVGLFSIFSIRLYEILKFIDRNQFISNNRINATDRVLNFQYCYRSIDPATYKELLSFYTIQYWFEYVLFSIIILSVLSLISYHYFIPLFKDGMNSNLNIHTKLYLTLSLCFITFEIILLSLHSIITDSDNDNTSTQVHYLQTMLFVYNIRCILFPLIISLTTSNNLKTLFRDYFIQHSFLNYIDENETTNAMLNDPVFVSSDKNFNNGHIDL